MVENRYVGIKSRGIYETPGGTIFNVSHQDLEGVALDREVLRIKQMLEPELARVIYYGY
jgi:argininosuccinate synthase